MSDTFEAYITYDEYKELGGLVSDTTFSLLERKSQRFLDTFTQNRLKAMTDIPDEVKEALTIMIDVMNGSDGEKLTSFSNGKVTMNFDVSMTEEQKMYYVISMILPLSLISRVVD